MDFFLIIHTGTEEEHKIYLLTSEDISADFYLNKDSGKFIISSKKALVPKYEVIDKKRSLDKIENLIKCAEFYKNRSFLFTKLSTVDPDFGRILPEYNIEIDYNYDIPDFFKKQKEMHLIVS